MWKVIRQWRLEYCWPQCRSRVKQFRDHNNHVLVLCSWRTFVTNYSSDEYQFLHKSILPTSHFQASLPHLAVPELPKTCERYLRAIQPITAPENFQKTEKIVNTFLTGEGQELQKILVENDKKNKHSSYILEPWNDMYLKSRTPIVVNFNPAIAFRFDPVSPVYNNQLFQACNKLIASLRFLRSLRKDCLEPHVFHLNPEKSDTQFFRKCMRLLPSSISSYGAYMFKAFPLDQLQYKHLFNSSRIPIHSRDELRHDPSARHLLVMRNGNFFVIDALDANGNIFPPSYYQALISYILKINCPAPKHPVGVLTTEDRDVWADARKKLEESGNGELLRLIDTAIYCMVLEDEDCSDDIQMSHQILQGPPGYRWFDKSFQLLVTPNGGAAFNFEHSWGDGVAVLRCFTDIYNDSVKNHHVHPDSVAANVDAPQLVRKLEFNITDEVKIMIDKATENYRKRTSNLRLDVLRNFCMNREYIKSKKMSPDGVIQLAFQLAIHKLYGHPVPTYEPSTTAAFKHGRTETIRSATVQSKEFCDAFLGKNRPSNNQLKAMVGTCAKIHGTLTKEAAMGQGFDRHLFALRHLAEQQGRPTPELFLDQSYIDSNHFVLSTSTLFGTSYIGGGFGPVVGDGFGIAYSFFEDYFGCLISSYPPNSDGASFRECLKSSIQDVQQILEQK